ncbi:hypothetical protein J3F84DRAFT_391667, partial [Trichoderma pleuroticola]
MAPRPRLSLGSLQSFFSFFLGIGLQQGENLGPSVCSGRQGVNRSHGRPHQALRHCWWWLLPHRRARICSGL